MFVTTTCGSAVRIDTVREIRPIDDGATVTLCLDGGEERVAVFDEWQRALYVNMLEFTPAHPGTYILHTDLRTGDVMMRECVVAWAITKLGLIFPVTADGFRSDLGQIPLIQYPDGSVHDSFVSWASYEVWLREYRAEPPTVGVSEEQA